jgi:superfamily II DNA/RNA helicase
MDYPGVSFVLQVGVTSREQYIHRLGRTARAGKEGSGLILLAPFERQFMLQVCASPFIFYSSVPHPSSSSFMLQDELGSLPIVLADAPPMVGPGSARIQKVPSSSHSSHLHTSPHIYLHKSISTPLSPHIYLHTSLPLLTPTLI